MTTSGHRPLAAWAILVSVISPGAGCFRPTIHDGGLLCAGGADGGVCPDGYYCSANGTCRKGSKPVCTPAMPHVGQICAPDPGRDCDPICQSRCDCGRCTYNGTGLVCLPPAGNEPRGAICTLGGADVCAPGTFCRSDCEGRIGRCSRFCGNDGISRVDACDGQDCPIFLNDALGDPTDLAVCGPPVQVCDPIGDSNTCGALALGCYVEDKTGATVCDCKGDRGPGAQCNLFNSCIPGFRCVTLGGGTSATTTCLKTCRIGGMDCAPSACAAIGGSGGAFGYCMP